MKVKRNSFVRCLAMLLCIVMVAVLLPEPEAKAWCDDPVLVSAKKSGSAVKITWEPVIGAVKYRVFRSTDGGTTWKKVGDTTGTSLKDKKVKNGQEYNYTVRCITKKGAWDSDYDDPGLYVQYWKCATPKITKITSETKGLKVTWGKVSGAAKYKLFRWDGTQWLKVGTTTKTYYTDVSVEPGNTYIYAVSCYSSNGKTRQSAYYDVGELDTQVATYYPKVAFKNVECSLTASGDGIVLEWNDNGAPWFYLEVKEDDGYWGKLDCVDNSAFEYTDLNVSSGHTYSYRVIGVDDEISVLEDKHIVGSYDAAGKSTEFFATPTLDPETVIENNAITVSWVEVPGAPNYRVFRKVAGGAWIKLGDTTTNSFTDTKAASGIEYFYTVRVMNSKKTAYISGYDDTGVTGFYVGEPTMVSTSVNNDGIVFRWNLVGTIEDYNIYRRTESGNWVNIDAVGSSDIDLASGVGEYIDKNYINGVQYYYSVACAENGGGADISTYNKTGLGCKPYEAPARLALAVTASGVKVTWNAVKGVTSYRLFRKEWGGTTWDVVATVNGTTYTDGSLKDSGTYVYTVRCLAPNGNYASGWETDDAAFAITYYSNPKLISAKMLGQSDVNYSRIKLEWEEVTGSQYYNIYRKEGTGSWQLLLTDFDAYTPDGTMFYDDGSILPLNSGKTYTYTVRCSDGSGENISFYDKTGVSCVFVQMPQIDSFDVDVDGISVKSITVKWKPVAGAKGYKVYRKVPGGSWTLLKTINGTTTLTFKDTKNLVYGQDYIYVVRAFSGTTLSDYFVDGWIVNAS
ncbi:MAG: hypothetical protein IKQ10_08450 [Oscillospiraceae bacterium]|nr:hypothetical protein [Oscillospiraceae bacterium]